MLLGSVLAAAGLFGSTVLAMEPASSQVTIAMTIAPARKKKEPKKAKLSEPLIIWSGNKEGPPKRTHTRSDRISRDRQRPMKLRNMYIRQGRANKDRSFYTHISVK